MALEASTGRSSTWLFDVDLTDLARRPSSNDDVLQLAKEKKKNSAECSVLARAPVGKVHYV